MAKLTMKQMLWLGKPRQWHKDWRSISLTVDGKTRYPDRCPSIVAAWDQDISSTSQVSVAPSGAEGGLYVFQTPSSQMAMGLSKDGVTIRYMAQGSTLLTKSPLEIKADTATVRFQRKGAVVTLSWSEDGNTFHDALTATLPGIGKSYSFGWYWQNDNEVAFTATVGQFQVVSLAPDSANKAVVVR